MSKYNTNDMVQHEDGLWEVINYYRGWYEIRNAETGAMKKARENQLELAEFDNDESDEDLASGSKIERAMKKYRHGYVPTLSRSGKKSLCNGDELAMAMAGLSHHAIAHAADYLYANIDKWDKIPHATKYGHLNNGQIRMNSGNRIRGAVKRGDATLEQAIEAIQYAAGCYQDAEAKAQDAKEAIESGKADV